MLLNDTMDQVRDLEEKISSFVVRIRELSQKSPEEKEKMLLSVDLENLSGSLEIEQKILELAMFFDKINLISERFNIMRDYYANMFIEPKKDTVNEQLKKIEEDVKFPKKKE